MGVYELSERSKMEDTHPGNYLYEVLRVVDETEVESDAVSLLNGYLRIKAVTVLIFSQVCWFNHGLVKPYGDIIELTICMY